MIWVSFQWTLEGEDTNAERRFWERNASCYVMWIILVLSSYKISEKNQSPPPCLWCSSVAFFSPTLFSLFFSFLPLLSSFLFFFQWLAMEHLPTDGSRWNQRLGYPSPMTQSLHVPSPGLHSLVHAVPDAWHTLLLIFCQAINNPLIFQVSSLLSGFLWPAPSLPTSRQKYN